MKTTTKYENSNKTKLTAIKKNERTKEGKKICCK
jgi:hypothetical protein